MDLLEVWETDTDEQYVCAQGYGVAVTVILDAVFFGALVIVFWWWMTSCCIDLTRRNCQLSRLDTQCLRNTYTILKQFAEVKVAVMADGARCDIVNP